MSASSILPHRQGGSEQCPSGDLGTPASLPNTDMLPNSCRQRSQWLWEEREGQERCLFTQPVFLREEQSLTLFLWKFPSILVGEQARLSRSSPWGRRAGERSRGACSGAGTQHLSMADTFRTDLGAAGLGQEWAGLCSAPGLHLGVRITSVLPISNSKWLAGILEIWKDAPLFPTFFFYIFRD